jgi:hypothetical protein
VLAWLATNSDRDSWIHESTRRVDVTRDGGRVPVLTARVPRRARTVGAMNARRPARGAHALVQEIPPYGWWVPIQVDTLLASIPTVKKHRRAGRQAGCRLVGVLAGAGPQIPAE